jgi:regulator of protease activity HflC (stomatin/prohibitin superfamily)
MEEQGIKERFGKIQEGILEPGLHLKWPWPIETVRKFPTRWILTETIGYDPTGQPEDFIWSRPHGLQEYRFVVGNGNELISIDSVIYYRLKDLVQFLFEMENPIETMVALAYRIFMQETVLLSLDQLLSRDRAEFAHRIEERLQREVEKERLGIEIIGVNLKSIHPPLDVASAYQQVVSSYLAKETEILRGKAYKASTLPEAEAQAVTKKASAEVYASRRGGEARGESDRFKRIAEAYGFHPSLFRTRRRLKAMQSALDGKRVIVIDDRLFEGAVEQWIDIRPSKSAFSTEGSDAYIELGGDKY